MKKVVVFFVVVMTCSIIAQQAFTASTGPGVTSDQALQMLKDGNARFSAGHAQHPHQDAARLLETATNGQHPFATVITCSDSRVPVEIVFDQGIGDTFVIRVAGNVIDTDEAGSVEYGVDHLHTPVFVVLGHTNCGACTAVTEGAHLTGNIPALVDNIIPAKDKAIANYPHLTGSALVAEVIKQNVWQSIEDLYEISPISADLARAGNLKVIGAIYDIKTGQIEWMGQHPDEQNILNPVVNVEPWVSGKVYIKDDKVSHNGKVWLCGWYTTAEPGTTGEWGPWQELK
jgi:carbonic anhydrase